MTVKIPVLQKKMFDILDGQYPLHVFVAPGIVGVGFQSGRVREAKVQQSFCFDMQGIRRAGYPFVKERNGIDRSGGVGVQPAEHALVRGII